VLTRQMSGAAISKNPNSNGTDLKEVRGGGKTGRNQDGEHFSLPSGESLHVKLRVILGDVRNEAWGERGVAGRGGKGRSAGKRRDTGSR